MAEIVRFPSRARRRIARGLLHLAVAMSRFAERLAVKVGEHDHGSVSGLAAVITAFGIVRCTNRLDRLAAWIGGLHP